MKNLVLTLLIIVCILNCVTNFEIQDIRKTFNGKDCIEGSLLSLENGPVLSTSSVLHKEGERAILEQLTLLNTSVLTSKSNNVKSALSELHELASFNKIKYHYELVDEEGPAHSRIFTVELHLGNEVFREEGSSLKGARQAVATVALQNTAYNRPPVKEESGESEKNTPTVQLNNIGLQHGMKVTYENVDKSILEQERYRSYSNVYDKHQKTYLARLNHSIYHPDTDTLKVKTRDGEPAIPPFLVRVYVDDSDYLGVGLTVQSAKHAAALQALRDMKRRALLENSDCATEGKEQSCKIKKQNLKSPISLVYEEGQKRKMAVDFDIVEERGPGHKKVFVMRCKLGDLVVDAEGKSKKEAKRLAAELMLEKIKDLPAIKKTEDFSMLYKNKKKKNKKNKIIKTQLDKAKMFAEDALTSALDYITDWTTSSDDDTSGKPQQTDKTQQTDSFNSGSSTFGMKDELLFLSQSLGIKTEFLDLNGLDGKAFTLLSLTTKPPHVCIGEGIELKDAHENVSLRAIKLIHKLIDLSYTKELVDDDSQYYEVENDEIALNVVEDDSKDEL